MVVPPGMKIMQGISHLDLGFTEVWVEKGREIGECSPKASDSGLRKVVSIEARYMPDHPLFIMRITVGGLAKRRAMLSKLRDSVGLRENSPLRWVLKAQLRRIFDSQ